MADDDIQIGIDAGAAIDGLGRVAKGFEEIARSAGLSGKALNQATNQMERSVGTVAAAIAKQTQARKTDLRTISEQITAEQKLAAVQRAEKNTGVRTNAAGQAISASSGQFVDKGQQSFYQNQIALAERLGARQEDLARQRERSARQMQLETAFASKFYGVADQGASKLQRVANVMAQIPPATWATKITEAQQRIMGMSNSTRYALYDVSSSFGVAGAAIAGFGVAAITAAITHERAFANVMRTTQTTAEGYEVLRRQLEVMSMELPVTFEELTNIASAAGQLGISAGGVASFTSTVAKLSATTNLSSDAAGVALARFRAFFAEVGQDKGLNVTERTFSNLASSILKVGVNSIATETGIVNVATQIASMGQYAGYTANQTIGLAGALSSIGVAPELSRGTITRTFSLIGTAVSKGGDQLTKFAQLAGMSAQEFKASWGTETFAQTFTQMINGLYDVTQSGEDANLMLMELGFNSVRDRPLLLRLAGAANEAGEAGGLLAQTMADAYTGWVQNSELALQYSKISQTTSARIQVLGQSFEQLFASMGQQSGGFVGEMASQLTTLIRGFEEFSNSEAGQTFGTIAVQAALVVGALALMVGAAARGAASLQGIGTAWDAIKTKTDTATTAVGRFGTAMKIVNLSLGLLGLAATIAAIVGGFIAMNDAAQKAKRGVQDVDGLVAAMAEDAKNGADGVTFYAESNDKAAAASKASAEQAKGMAEALGGVQGSALGSADALDSSAESASRAAYAYGDAAKEFVRASLAQSETFQSLFDPTQKWGTGMETFFGGGLTLEDLGFNPSDLDWNDYIDSSLESGFDSERMKKDIAKRIGVSNINELDPFNAEGAEAAAIANYVSEAAAAIGNLPPEIQKVINANAALEGSSAEAFSELVEGGEGALDIMSELPEATQKAVDGMAQGFAKFADTGALIGLTQKMNEIFGQQDVDFETMSSQWEEAWTSAYGGASFSLEAYLGVQARAAQEQTNFIGNLSTVGDRLANLGYGDMADQLLSELAAMGPEANRLVQALVDGTDDQLTQFADNFGRTGYDATVKLATEMALGNEIIKNIMATGGAEALAAFNAKLAEGYGVNDALAALQRTIDGKPMQTKWRPPGTPPDLTPGQRAEWEWRNRLSLVATVRTIQGGAALTNGHITVDPGYAGGGYTGNGGKYDYAGAVHRGEFVMTKEATRAIGVGNLYAMMRAAQGGRAAPRGRGFAQGGAVTGGGMSTVIAYLSPEDRELLRSIQPVVRIGDREIARAQGSANFRTTRTGVG